MKKSINYLFIFGFLFFVFSFSVNALEASMSVKCNTLKLNGSSTCKVYANISGGGLEGVSVSSLEIVSGDDVIAIAETFKANDNRFSARKNVYLGTFKIKSLGKNGTGKVNLKLVARSDPGQATVTLSPKTGVVATFNVLSSVATLSSISVNDAPINGFDSNVYSYKLSGITNSSVKVSALGSLSSVKVSGAGTHKLKCGNNTVVLNTVSQDKSKKLKYKLTINRTCDDNTTLKNIVLSSGTLAPAFSASTTDYKVNVDSKTENITINVDKGSEGQKISGLVNNKKLAFGDNTFKIKVTSEKGSSRTYKIIVNRADDRSNNAFLSTLTLDSGKLNFDKNVFNYEVKVLNTVEKINVVANAEDAKAKVDVTNPDTLKEGENNIVVKVTAENGSTQEYTIKVNRLKAGEVMGDNPNIKLLTITGYTINFNPLTTSYNLKIDNKTDSLGINVIMEEDGATYLISGNENLKDGSVIVIDTTSLDGTKNTYKIIIEKSNTDFYILIGAGVLLVGSLSAIIAIMVKKRKGKNNGIMDSIGSSAGSVDVSKSDAVEDVNPIQEESVEGGDFGKSKSWFRKHKSIPKNEVMSFEELKKYDPTNKENGIVGRSAPSEEYERVEITEDQTKQCPKCGHRINFSAKVCPYCDKEF